MSSLNISPETMEELNVFSDSERLMFPTEYIQFAFAWMAFNRVYNENRNESQETQRVVGMGDQLEGIWAMVVDLARELVSMECIGGQKDNLGGYKPKPEVKSATLFLRDNLRIDNFPITTACNFAGCRIEKRMTCDSVIIEPWTHSKMAALLRLLYQVRCNLVHGDKRVMARGFQGVRDHRLVHLSYEIIKIILREIGSTARITQ